MVQEARDIEVKHHEKNRKFYAVVKEKECVLSYRQKAAGVLDYERTFVPEEIRSRGIGSRIVHEALDYARNHDYTVIATCWFVEQYIADHPEYRDLLFKE